MNTAEQIGAILFALLVLTALWRIAELLNEAIKQLRLIKWWIAHAQGENLDSKV